MTAVGHVCAQQPVQAVTLEQAIRLARGASPIVVTAQGSTRAAQLDTRTALWQYIPALTLTPQANLLLSSGQARLDPVTSELISGNQSTFSYSFGLNATYTLFDGFMRTYQLRRQRALEAAANASLTTTMFASDYGATQAFFTALADQQLVVVAQSNVASAEAQLKLATAKLHAGSGRLSDSLTAQGTYLQAKLGVLQAQSNLVVGESNLGRLVGMPGRVTALDDSAFYRLPPPVDTAAIRVEVMASAPSLRSLSANVTAAHEAYKSAKSTYFPTISVSAGDNWTANQENNFTLTPRRSLNLGFFFSPWTSLQRETQVEEASIEVTDAEVELADQRNFLAAQVNQVFAALSTAEETIAVTQASVTTGELNLRIATDQYRTGVSTITDVLTAQQQLLSAQGAAVQARYSYLLAKAQLEGIIGRKV
jgi:outer membrane protein TolC